MSNKDIEIIEDKKDRFFDILYEAFRQNEVRPFEIAIENILADRERKIEDIQRLQETLDKSDASNVELEKQLKKYKNMYQAEHRIHLVRNEQLERKEIAVKKANKYNALVENIKEKNKEVDYRLNETMITQNDMYYNIGKKEVLQDLLETIGGEKK